MLMICSLVGAVVAYATDMHEVGWLIYIGNLVSIVQAQLSLKLDGILCQMTKIFTYWLNDFKPLLLQFFPATGRGKGGGGAGVAIIGMMFAKAMGAMGLGGVGLLTMKVQNRLSYYS